MPGNKADLTTDSGPGGLENWLYTLATGDDEARRGREIPQSQRRAQPQNFIRHVCASGLSKTGDAVVDPKVVLPWVLGALGAPVFLIGLLVPIRESLALLPQIAVSGVIRRYPVRKRFWAASAVVQGLSTILMALAGLAGLHGAVAGGAIMALLAVFSLARGVASVAGKDTLGKTVAKGNRGKVSGYASTGSGVVAALLGVYLVASPDAARPGWLLYAILAAAGASWFLAAATFAAIEEFPGAAQRGRSIRDLFASQIVLLRKDRELQKFILARSLMISTALVGPVYVGLAQVGTGRALDGLGWLIIASGLAGALSSAFWGIFSDRSSRLTMALAAGLAGGLGLAVLAVLALFPALQGRIAFYAAILFIVGIAHAGVRIGRKTHVVDLAGRDRKSEYVALSNTVIGVFLLAIGGLSSILLGFGFEIAIAALSAMALLGGAMAFTMKHVQGD